MGIFKLTKGELKKIFLKPGIFVVTALLVIVLTISSLIFNISDRKNMIANINGDTISQMYSASFGATSETNTLSKNFLNNRYIITSENIINFYKNEINNSENSKKEELHNKLSEIKSDFATLKNWAGGSSTVSDDDKENQRNIVKQGLQEFNSLFNSTINGYQGFNYLLISDTAKSSYDLFISKVLTQPFGNTISYLATVNKIEELNTFNYLKNYINNLKVYLPDIKTIENCQNNFNLAKQNLALIENEIEELKSNYPFNNTLEKKNEFKILVTKYQQASINIYNLTSLSMNSSALDKYSDDEIQNFYTFAGEKYNTKYTINEQKNLCQFYLDNNKYAFEYANPLSLIESSNIQPTVYDFMYFALELCSFIIIIYIVFLGATMIASEFSSGTIKQLAIRPYSRGKILFSKLLATVFVGLLFLLLTFIVTFIIGGILFGLESLNMIMVFNSSIVTAVNPLVLIILLFLCKTIEIIFYAILSLSISTLFTSNSGSIVISLLIYFVSFVLTMFTTNLGIFRFLPFVNTNLFAYFGSHLLVKSDNIFANMFSKIIPNDMNFYISFLIICLFSVLLYTITLIVFKKRDIK